ncbi:Putative bacteriophage protein [Pseudomonas synxantha]|uniref:Bacteriophage protein n=1 Tax=Pseudomonas synxantha TaxID=47883 RepID=A0A3G7U4I8_9PSED|nr:phage tail tip lysozyme [Pseudomonas synxantha]AZE53479.1 Putative bacteriophage protein [Pseudomonas synxantha]
MADQDVIKEFLVGLGFKVDEKGAKDFSTGIDVATKSVVRLVATIAGASLTVAAGVSAFASNLEGLYYASQRVGSSAESLKSAEYAARDLGASAEEARGSIEGMAKFLRDTPGGEDFLKGIGVQTRDANNNLLDTTDLLVNVGQKLKAMPWYQANQYAGVLGINEQTLRAIRDDKFGAKLEQNRRKLSNSGLDQATKDAHAFMETLRDVGLQFEVFSVQVQSALMRKLGPDLQRFAAWFGQNGPMIADRVAEIAVKLIDFVDRCIPYLQKIWDFFVRLDEATDGWSTRIIALLFVLNALGALSIAAGVARLAGSFLSLGTAITGLSGAAAIITAIAGAAALLYSPTLNDGEEAEIRKIRERQGLPPVEEQTPEQASNERVVSDAWKKLQNGDKDKASFVQDFFEAQGWTKDQAAGITANLAAESSTFDPKAMGDGGRARGIGQWHPDRQREFEKWAGFNIRDDRADLIKQLEFAHYELTEGAETSAGSRIRDTKGASAAGEAASRGWLRPGATQEARDREARVRAAMAYQLANDGAPKQLQSLPQPELSPEVADALARAQANAGRTAEQMMRASENSASTDIAVNNYNTSKAIAPGQAAPAQIAINQKTDIHVNGTSDPLATANAVSSAQGRVGEQMARNMGSAVN